MLDQKRVVAGRDDVDDGIADGNNIKAGGTHGRGA
jgi:hypothetical protein